MARANPTPVTVIGLGSMGAALAEAFLAAGHPTTVWNRSPGKAAPLVARGATRSETIEDAVAASPLVVACLSTYDATTDALGPAAGALDGRTLVTLNSGVPAGARAMAGWAAAQGARFLDGAIKNVPDAIGGHDTQLCYSGDRAVFDEHETTLRVLGGDTVHLGDEPDIAALYESAVGATLLPALLGFLHGAALVSAHGVEASALVPYAVKWLAMIGSVLPTLADEIDTGDYDHPASSIGTFHEALAEDRQLASEAAIDVSWQVPMHDLVERAVTEGRGGQSVSALVELIRKQRPAG